MSDVYEKYSIRSEYSLSVDYKKLSDEESRNRAYYSRAGRNDNSVSVSDEKTSHLSSEYKTWRFTCRSSNITLGMSMHSSDSSKTVAELIFWYWNEQKEIVILKKIVHAFGVGSPTCSASTNGSTPVNEKFNVLIRLLDDRIFSENNRLESYYGDYEGIETVTLSIAGTENEETTFVIPKLDLIRASPVFRRMFANEMTEKATGKVDIKDTTPEEFSDFLKAISPKQEHPTPSNVFALLKLADYYNVQSLRDRCEEHLVNCVEIPLVDLLNSVKLYGLNNLKAKLMASFREIGLLDFVRQVKPKLDLVNQLAEMIV